LAGFRVGTELVICVARGKAVREEPSARGLREDEIQVRDLELIEGIRARRPEAFRALFARHAPMVHALLRRVVRDPALAEDVLREVFLRVWKRPHDYEKGRGSVRAWLTNMAHRSALDQIRWDESQQSRGRTFGTRAAPGPLDEPIRKVVDRLALDEERIRVRRGIEELPPEQRVVILLMYFGSRSASEVALELDIPLGTVKSRARLGLRRLRANLPVERDRSIEPNASG
jgi:RNA polymerase sigma-70 factor (ECF subfamily)